MNNLNQCTIYILLWCLYKVGGGLLFQGGGIISQVLMLLIILLSFWNVIYAFSKYKLPLFFKAIIILICVFSIYGIFPILNKETFIVRALDNYEVPSYNYLKVIYMSLLPVFPFYVYSRKGYLTESTISRWFNIFLVLVLIQYFGNIRTSMLSTGNNEVGFTNNIAYSLVSLLPMLLLKNIGMVRRYIVLGILFLLILYGMKRGAIIIGVLMLIWYIKRTFNTLSRTIRHKFIFVVSLFLVAISIFTINLYNKSTYFQYRIEQTKEGNSSGRDIILDNLISYFKYEATPTQKLFGCGANATIKIGENYAHNDWIEILTNQGIFGIFIYVIYWLLVFRSWKSLNKDSVAYTIVGMCLLNIFLSSFFSMSYSSYSIYMAVCLGYSFSRLNNKICAV